MKMHYCNECGKVFKRKRHLRFHHLNEHTATKRYKSSYLGKGLKMKFVAIPSSNEAVKKCEFCNRIFYYEKALKNHQENVHFEKKKLQCIKCQKCFDRSNNLKRHEKQCSKQTIYQCNNCEKIFTRLDNLIRHRKKCVHNEKLYRCEKCFKRFARRGNYIQHREVCGHQQHPETRESYNKVKVKTKNQKPLYLNLKRLMKPKREYNGNMSSVGIGIKSKYQCNHCEKKFTQFDAFARHRKQCRHKQGNFKCNNCVKYFSQHNNLLRHQDICMRKHKYSNEQKPYGNRLKKRCIKWEILKHKHGLNNNNHKKSVISNNNYN